MEAGGFTLADYPEEQVEIWPENLQAYELFLYMRTQWRGAGMGLIGLDYGPLHHRMDRMKLEPDEYEELEADVQVMEIAAIGAMNDKDE
ncbi:DUF1799 domain-containing protein [Massilia sp. DD77]|uniref:DUF1799 domain-containing protein n=1 Tax=Massilia sp. DD77 TaxID=3109349 RepID=UPI002FFDDBB8